MPSLQDQANADVIIIGAGPAGLAAAAACQKENWTVVTLENGKSLARRDRTDGAQIAGGVGGAGVFSDGKFSFYPSATRLWAILPQSDLRIAYNWFRSLLLRHSTRAPHFPRLIPQTETSKEEPLFYTKEYKSVYISFAGRSAMINELSSNTDLRLRTHVTAIKFGPSRVCIEATTVKSDQPPHIIQLSGRALIIATGRLGPLLLQRMLPSELMLYRRLEVGVRIEQESDRFFLSETLVADPKLIWRNPLRQLEWRTFCCCRNGEIVPVIIEGTVSASGRADVAPTGRSSVGFHVRMLNQDQAERAWSELRDRTINLKTLVNEPMGVFMGTDAGNQGSQISGVLGPRISRAIKAGLSQLIQTTPGDWTRTTLYGPAIEGIIYYPRLDVGCGYQIFPLGSRATRAGNLEA
jgi:hypothetical protein